MQIRNAIPSDEAICNRFYNEHYDRRRTAEQWRWEFVEPTKAGPLPFVVAVDEGEIVGTQAYIPVRFIDEAGVFLTAKSEETLVSSKMRGKNVFGKMYDQLFQVARDNACMSIWGFTPADRAFRKLQFDIPAATGQLLLVLAPQSLAQVANAQGDGGSGGRRLGLRLAGLILSVWSKLAAFGSDALAADERLTDLQDAHLFDEQYSRRFIDAWGGTTILRDHEYMQWRIFDNPYRQANVVGIVRDNILVGHVALAVDEEGAGYLVDLIAAHPLGKQDDARIVRLLIAEAVQRLAHIGASCVRGWTLNDHPFDILVRRAALCRGFIVIRRGSWVVYQTRFQTRSRGTSHDDFGNWYVTRLFTEGTTG